MKRSLIALLVMALLMPFLAPMTLAQDLPGKKQKILVTAYYSPLPNQRFYIRGSLEADIILNGRGTNGADGTEVFVGMLAAPKTYPFGTRIRIPGLGVGEVHDRGGAIVERANYDRIDVWMGRGEEGLARALNWGARMVEGDVYFTPHQVEPGLDFSWVKNTLPDSLVKRLSRQTPLRSPSVTNVPVEAPTAGDLKNLQIALTQFGFYNGPIDGEMTDLTQEAVTLFQLSHDVIEDRTDQGAGRFGPKTRQTLKTQVDNYNYESAKASEDLNEYRFLLASGLGKNASGAEVGALQQLLWELGYYHGPISHQYDEHTIEAVFAFQRDRGVLNDAWDTGAGYYGNQTHKALVAAVDERLTKVKEYPKDMQTWIPLDRDLPEIEALNPVDLNPQKSLNFEAFNLNKKVVQEKDFVYDLDFGDRGEVVSALQRILIAEGHLEADLDTGYFGNQTKSALIAFQLARGVIDSAESNGAGRVGPKTRKTLNDLL